MNRYTMKTILLFAITTFAFAEPMYRNELRHLHERLRQERIQKTVQDTFHMIETQIIQAASGNATETNFTLFCKEPNVMQEQWFRYGHRNCMYKNQGATYRLCESEANNPLIPIYPKPRCSVKDGYSLYSRPPSDELDANRIPRPILEDIPLIYIQHFFQKLNMQFPDLSLQISHERKSTTEGIFENECCPIYIVSW